MADLEYTYAGQWFDDMGALALTFNDAPAMGVELANSPLPRAQTNTLAKNLLGSNIAPYYEQPGAVGPEA
jgi:hypothetical protein